MSSGYKLPKVGLGTSYYEKDYKFVRAALEAGYRHFDTASLYGTEKMIGEAIKESKVDRSQLFITSKFWNDEKPDISAALNRSLQNLQTNYLDLYLVHWPGCVFKEG